MLTGCGGSPAPISVSISAGSSTVDGSDTTALTAAVTNDRNAAGVSWTVSGGTLSNTTTTSATFTAPAATTSSQTVTVTATSVADAADTGTASITIPAKPTVSTTSTSLTGSVGAAFSVTLQGSGGIPPYKSWVVSNTGSALPACLTLSSAGVLATTSGSAPTASCAGAYGNLIFTYSDSGTPTPLTATSSALTVTINAAPAITITPALPSAAVGTAYTGSVGAAGGVGTLTYSVASGVLPPDLTLNSSTGAISGTPKTADVGTASFKITAADAYGDSATSAALSLTVAAAPAITFTSSTMSAGTYNVAYGASAAASGGAGALTYSISAGALPQDLALNTNTGAISGTPSKAADVGTFNFTVKAADAYGDSNTQAYQLLVSYPTMTVTPATLPTGYIGSAYPSTSLAATGGTGVSANYSWAVTGGSLPAGLQLSSTGAITGSPTGPTTGAISFSVTVSDTVAGIASTSTPLSITVDLGITITPITLPTGYTQSTYPPQGSSSTLSASGGAGAPYTWSWTAAPGSSLPNAMSIGATTGTIGGTPTTTGTYNVVVKATDSATPANTATLNLSITIGQGVTVMVPTLAAAYPGTAYSSPAFSASGGTNTNFQWSWAAASGSTLPAGFSINSSTGVISAASPVNTGSTSAMYNVVVTATDSLGNKGTGNATIVVEASVSVATTSLPAGTVAVSYSQALAASGGSGTYTTWQITTGATTLAAIGLGLNTSNGVISGSSPTLGTANFSVEVTDSQGHTSAPVALSIAVNNQLKFNQSTLPPGNVGTGYSQTLTASGGAGGPYSFTATSSNLSSYGLSLATTGAISGTPTQSGTASFTAVATDSGSNQVQQPLSIQVYGALSLPVSNSLPAGYTNVVYSGSINGSGGSSNLSISITSPLSPANNTLAASVSGNTVNISGTPTTATTESLTVQLTDNTTTNAISQAYSFSVSTPTAVSLPAPNPGTLPSATMNSVYTGSINATGGAGTYAWTINGTTVTSSGLSLGNGLTATNSGSNVLSISGTPTSTTSVALTNVKVADGETPPSTATQSYTIAVNPAGSTVSGQFSLQNYCYNGSSNLPVTFTVGLYNGTTLVQSTTSASDGTYSFSSIPDGTYTITPSISGAASLFYPASLSTGALSSSGTNNLTGQNFNAQVAFTVSGTVTYNHSGTAQTGQTYLTLSGGCAAGNGSVGTSITESTLTGGGSFTIRGVQPGNYTLTAWMDPLGQGLQNAIDPTGSNSNVTVTDANATANVTMNDPTFTTPTEDPTISTIIPNAQGVLIEFNPSENSNGVEDANEYTVQWSSSPTLGGGSGGGQFASVAGSYTFTAEGSKNVWVLTNALLAGTGYSFTSGQTYYFQARSFDTLDTANPHPTGWCNYTSSGCSGTSGFTGVTIGTPACTASCTAVSSSVTIPAAITINSGAPLYLGLVQLSSSSGGNPIGIYITEIASPSSGANDFTVTVPSGSDYAVIGILDQYKNGGFGAGAVSNTRQNLQGNLTISGSTQTVPGITLPTANSVATVSTQYSSSSCQGCGATTTNYQLNFEVEESNKLPVAVTLNAGPNLINTSGTVAIDMANDCNGCGNTQFQYTAALPGGAPSVGDTYDFTVTYLNPDGTTSQDTGSTVNGAVTAFGSTGAVVGASDLATSLAPSANSSTSTTPNFTWTFPANASNYVYWFSISPATCSGSCSSIWQVPGNNSKSNGFTYAETQTGASIGQLTWGTDPTGGGSTPTGSLTPGSLYNWSLQVQDGNGNQAQTTTWYQP